MTHRQGRAGNRLFLNGNMQFAERDEYRYHEALVHLVLAAFAAAGCRRLQVAVLGGGDGMAVREIPGTPAFQSGHLVELDPAMTRCSRTTPVLARLNGHSLSSTQGDHRQHRCLQVAREPEDARATVFDVIVVDFPDPTNFNIGKLYTNSSAAPLDQRLSPRLAMIRPPRRWWRARASGPWCRRSNRWA